MFLSIDVIRKNMDAIDAMLHARQSGVETFAGAVKLICDMCAAGATQYGRDECPTMDDIATMPLKDYRKAFMAASTYLVDEMRDEEETEKEGEDDKKNASHSERLSTTGA